MTTQTLNETEAALAEGLAPMPEDLTVDRLRLLALKEKRDELEAEINELRGRFADRMQEAGVTGFILNGKVRARTSTVQTSRIDSRKLANELPAVHAQYLKVTESVRVTVS